MITLLVVLAVGAGSYLMRSGPILWHGRAQPPDWVDRAALLAATSALSAVVTSAVLHHERAGHPEARLSAIVAVTVALVLASESTTPEPCAQVRILPRARFAKVLARRARCRALRRGQIAARARLASS